jgi:ABC-2 type transport system ATP-binding protein
VINKGRIVADGTAEDLLRRAANHGAVAIRLPRDKADALAKALAALPGVARVETAAGVNGSAQLRAMPHASAALLEPVADLLRREQISVDEIYVERGKLDDVFREITTSAQA